MLPAALGSHLQTGRTIKVAIQMPVLWSLTCMAASKSPAQVSPCTAQASPILSGEGLRPDAAEGWLCSAPDQQDMDVVSTLTEHCSHATCLNPQQNHGPAPCYIVQHAPPPHKSSSRAPRLPDWPLCSHLLRGSHGLGTWPTCAAKQYGLVTAPGLEAAGTRPAVQSSPPLFAPQPLERHVAQHQACTVSA